MTYEKLLTKCLELLLERNYLKNDICGLQRPKKSRAEAGEQIFLNFLPSEIQYVCLYWVYYLKGSKLIIYDEDPRHYFFKRYLLYWLEALSLMGRISKSIGLIDDLQNTTDVSYLLMLYITSCLQII